MKQQQTPPVLLWLAVLLISATLAHAKEEDRASEHVALEDHEYTGAGGGVHGSSSLDESAHGAEDEHHEPADAILFPFFMLLLGVCTHYFLSRYAQWMPYTAAMFILGAVIGVAVTRNEKEAETLLHVSIDDFWLNINGELLLLSFLPGLIYHDATAQNTHLFERAFGQCLIFAFPMVLAGTVLTALIGYHILPYDWSFNLAMTFGAILSATDPVAVAALLEAVGAPPRLKVHIAGESLLNDGAAIVFFNIFSSLFLFELNVDGLGEDIDFPNGVALFFRKSVGAACIGAMFSLGFLPFMKNLHRSLEKEENVVQTGLTITSAYLCYFTAEVAFKTSGVIAVLTLGVVGKAFGHIYINDHELLEHFWKVAEWLLNTVLFGLGGILWGTVIANNDPEHPEAEFNGQDWGYLVLVYVLITLIRFGLFASVFPITSRIGLKSSWQEMVFQSFGGLRGAVGISLAIFLDNTVRSHADEIDLEFILQSNKLYGMVGGIAFLSLAVNGVVAGPLLKSLGLSDITDTRKKILDCYRYNFREHALESFVRLLGQPRFQKVNLDLVRVHVPFLREVSYADLAHAIEQHEERTDLIKEKLRTVESNSMRMDLLRQSLADAQEVLSRKPRKPRKPRKHHLSKVFSSQSSLTEMRRLFLELVRAGYEHQVKEGELGRREFVAYSLFEALDLASDDVDNGYRLNDWHHLVDASHHASMEERVRQKIALWQGHPLAKKIKSNKKASKKNTILVPELVNDAFQSFLNADDNPVDPNLLDIRTKVERCLAFINAHNHAASIMKHEFVNSAKELHEGAEATVLEESAEQVKKAEGFLKSLPEEEIELVVSHKVSKIILNRTAQYVEELAESRLLKEQEAGAFLEEIQHHVDHVEQCFGACRIAANDLSSPKPPAVLFEDTALEEISEEHQTTEEGLHGNVRHGADEEHGDNNDEHNKYEYETATRDDEQ